MGSWVGRTQSVLERRASMLEALGKHLPKVGRRKVEREEGRKGEEEEREALGRE